MSFESVTNTILKEAINSAIYIDDKVLVPYEDNTEDLFQPKNLYSSFRENKCSLDIYRFKKEDLDQIDRFIYFNRDLIILDWHLDGAYEGNLMPALTLIEKAIDSESLHFCVIYTSEPQSSLQESVIYTIASYFSGLNENIAKSNYAAIRELLDQSGLDQPSMQEILIKLSSLTKEFFFEFKQPQNRKEISKEINEIISKFSNRKAFEEFINSLDFPVIGYNPRLICLGFVLNQTPVPQQSLTAKVEPSNNRFTIKIDNLFIKAYSKEDTGVDIYNDFKDSIINQSNIFLSLLGLELRNRFRESSAFLGRELEMVNHLAFFFHRKSHFDGHEELFNEFLKDIWKDQVGSFLLEKDIELFKVIDEFKELEDIEEKLPLFKKDNAADRLALAQLNYLYNRLAIIRKENDEIRFGDVLKYEIAAGETVYLLCITPHCDCLRPEKIKGMFFFVEGKEINLGSAINEKGDGDYISFIKKDGDIICIDWTNGTDDCKPFSVYLPNNTMAGENKEISTTIAGRNCVLKYCCTIKENYCQRIGNKAFFYPLRVGIDFASFK